MSNYSLRININALAKDIVDKCQANLPEAKRKTLARIAKDTDEFVPYKTGKLSENVVLNETDSSITYATNYASFAFDPVAPSGVPKQYTKTVHEKAQGFPFDASIRANDLEWAEYFREELMKGVE